MTVKYYLKNLLNLHHVYSLSAMRLVFDQYIIYNYLISKFDISLLKIVDIFTINAFLYGFFTVFSGFLFDKYGAKVVFFISHIAHILSYVTLIFAFSNPNLILLFLLLDTAQGSFIVGKYEASIYQNVVNKLDSSGNEFPKFLAIFYSIGDIIKSINPLLTSILFIIPHKYMTVIIYTYILIQFSGFWIISKMDSTKTKNKKSPSILKIVKSSFLALKNKEKGSKVYIFSIFASLMYIYKEIFTISSKLFPQLQQTNMAAFKSFYHLAMSIGCIAGILISKHIIKKYRNAIIYKVPLIVLTILLTGALFENSTIIMYSICLAALTFCIFEITTDGQIDKSLNQDILGTINSSMWFLASLIGFFFSFFVSIISRFTDSHLILSIPFSMYIIGILICYRRSGEL